MAVHSFFHRSVAELGNERIPGSIYLARLTRTSYLVVVVGVVIVAFRTFNLHPTSQEVFALSAARF